VSAWSFVKWRKLLVWHVDRGDGRTCCGLLIDPGSLMDRSSGREPPGRLCSICKRLRKQQTDLPLRRAS
jgi:hypothetical protein